MGCSCRLRMFAIINLEKVDILSVNTWTHYIPSTELDEVSVLYTFSYCLDNENNFIFTFTP